MKQMINLYLQRFYNEKSETNIEHGTDEKKAPKEKASRLLLFYD